jgi:arylsulfatase A-like enzyme
VRLVDIAPTVYELMELPEPPHCDGQSLAPAFREEVLTPRLGYSETLYPREQFEASGQFPQAKNLKAVRIDNRHKLIWEIDGDGFEYYDLASNPDER